MYEFSLSHTGHKHITLTRPALCQHVLLHDLGTVSLIII